MPREKKTKAIEALQATFTKSSIGIFTDYRGITTAEMNALRRKLREAGIDLKVVKNTLAQIAATQAGRQELANSFAGQVAVIFGYNEVIQPARLLAEHIRNAKSALSIKGGFLKTRLLTANDVRSPAALPPREVLIAQVLGGMQSPIASLIGCLASPLQGLAGILQARAKQLETTKA